MAHRSGFLIPNASDAGIVGFRQAEPDAGDFSLLGNDRYGVLHGCSLSVNTLQVALTGGPHVVVADGEVSLIEGSHSVTLNPGSATDRFDLVGWSATDSALVVVPGTASDDPKFPELPEGFVLFGAVYIPAGVTSITTANVTDKRRLLTHGARGSAEAAGTFLKNVYADSGVTGVEMLGDGTLRWSDNAVRLAYTSGKLTVTGKVLRAASGLEVAGSLDIEDDLTAGGNISSSNFKRGSGDPTGNGVPGVPGDEYSRTDTGQKYIYRSGGIGWAEIYADEYPPGTLIASLLTGSDATTHMAGWLPLSGQTVPESQVGRLADLGEPFSNWNNGDGTWTLPDMTNRTIFGGGPVGALNKTNTVTLNQSNLPPHKHFANGASVGAGGSHDIAGSIQTSTAGAHRHVVDGGQHGHSINDPGHMHYGNHGMNARTNFCVAYWGGKNKVDGPFHDSSHTWSVDFVPWTSLETTGITVSPSSSSHSHTVSEAGGHSHTVQIGSIPAHSHPMPTESSVGASTPIDIRPAHMLVTFYVKI